jgi:MraZ protein
MDEKGPDNGPAMAQALASVELPDGSRPSRLDDRGRLRMPAEFRDYLRALREKKLFVTTMDFRTVRIYPIAVWREDRVWLASSTDPDARDLYFLANDMGADTEMDAQGRVLIHEELRKALGLENQALYLVPWAWRLDVYPEPIYQERKKQAREGAPEKLQRMEAKGLK